MVTPSAASQFAQSVGKPTTHPSAEGAPQKILVAMSGGVDSSVTAALLKTQGYDIVGVHMQLWDHGEENLERMGGRCCSLTDSNDARRVCDRLEIPYYVINSQSVFREGVVDYFVHEYLQQRTPNPCVECNNKIKFNYLFQKAEELGCDVVATGHYAQVIHDVPNKISRLRKAADPNKDQSYFLFGFHQNTLKRTLMPLGGLTKPMVRKLAEEFGLNVANKADSQEICFIGQEGYQGFIQRNVAPDMIPPGPIHTVSGDNAGEHEGLYKYTIGQKKGLEINARNNKDPYYVVGFDRDHNALIIGQEAALFHDELIATNVNWIIENDGLKDLRCKAKIRSRHPEADCTVTIFENEVVRVRFDQKQRAITPGQAIVFYDGDEVLGGGFIERLIRSG